MTSRTTALADPDRLAHLLARAEAGSIDEAERLMLDGAARAGPSLGVLAALAGVLAGGSGLLVFGDGAVSGLLAAGLLMVIGAGYVMSASWQGAGRAACEAREEAAHRLRLNMILSAVSAMAEEPDAGVRAGRLLREFHPPGSGGAGLSAAA